MYIYHANLKLKQAVADVEVAKKRRMKADISFHKYHRPNRYNDRSALQPANFIAL